ncbi:MAG: two-component regulator propeller domain-containing protein [Candidatus Omnitrophota bacterium]
MKSIKEFGLIKRILRTMIVVLVLFLPLHGLDPNQPLKEYIIETWDKTESGINLTTVNCIVQTQDGYLWIVTQTKLIRFDGIGFTEIPFGEKEKMHPEAVDLNTLCVDDGEDMLWLGGNGLMFFDRRTGKFKDFGQPSNNKVRYIKKDMKGNLWITFMEDERIDLISNNKRLHHYDTSNGIVPKKVNAIFEDQMGSLWFASREDGIFQFRNGKFFNYSIEDFNEKNIFINAMIIDNKGNLWIGAYDGLYKVTNRKATRYTAADGLSHKYILSLLEDSDKNLWVGTWKGLNRVILKENGTIQVEHLLDSAYIKALFEDKEKNLWVGTTNEGLKLLKNSKFVSYKKPNPIRDKEVFFYGNDRSGNILIAAQDGKLFRCKGPVILEVVELPDLSGAKISATAEDEQGNLWLGTNGMGVFRQQNGSYLNYTTQNGLVNNTIMTIFIDSDGNVWFGTTGGLSVWRRANQRIESFNFFPRLKDQLVNMIYEDQKHNILVATDKGITILYNGVFSNSPVELPKFKNIPITCIHEDSSQNEGGTFWVATKGIGLNRLNLKNNQIISYTEVLGSSANLISNMLVDDKDNFWLTSENSVLRVNKTELNRFSSKENSEISFTSFEESDGLRALSVTSSFKNTPGELYFITNKEMFVVNPDKIPVNKTPPTVIIESLHFNQRLVEIYPGIKLIAAPFKGQKNVSISFTAPTFLSPEKIKFKYMLEPLEKDWVMVGPGEKRSAYYPDLSPGTYTFRVRACNADGIWDREGSYVSFGIKPFFYQTNYFKLIILFLIILMGYGGFYIYKKRPFTKKKVEEEKEEKKKYQNSPLDDVLAAEYIKKLNHLMVVERVYKEDDISLQTLAKKMGITPHLLSQLLNERLSHNFSDFINYYRIEEAKKIFESPRGLSKKNSFVSDEVGFNNMTVFYKAFKKFTGKTPNEFKSEIKKNK